MSNFKPETLFACPACQRSGFTARGISAHECRTLGRRLTARERLAIAGHGPASDLPSSLSPQVSLSTLKPMPKTPSKALVKAGKPIDLDKLDTDQMRNSFVFDPVEHGKRALAMIGHVEGLKKERAVKAILAGIYLSQVKATLGHGPFGDWAKKHLGKTIRTGQHYMALASAFSRKSKLLLPELVGANQLTLDLQAQDGDGRAILAKLDKFVGASGLTELMQKHDVISAPAPKSPVANTAAGTALTHEATQTEEEKHLAAIADLRRSAIDTLTSLNELGDRWQLLTDAQLKVTLADMKALTRQMNAWLDTPPARRAAFDPAPYVSGEAEQAIITRRNEGVAFAALDVASPSA